MAAFFALVALLPLVHAPLSSIRGWALAVSTIFAATALLWSPALCPLNALSIKLGLLLSAIVSPLVLALLFYVTVTPAMRAERKDPLHLRRDAADTSYCIVRTPPGPAPESMKNQF